MEKEHKIKQDLINVVCDICGLWGQRQSVDEQTVKAVEIMFLYKKEYSLEEWCSFTDEIIAPITEVLRGYHGELLRYQLISISEKGKEISTFKDLALKIYLFIGNHLVPKYGDTPELRSYISCIVNLCEWIEKQYDITAVPLDINCFFKDTPPDDE